MHVGRTDSNLVTHALSNTRSNPDSRLVNRGWKKNGFRSSNRDIDYVPVTKPPSGASSLPQGASFLRVLIVSLLQIPFSGSLFHEIPIQLPKNEEAIDP